ncbi:hypothetical protein BpHYR1_019624 [Brachionus plicatilis]|uniref:Uncharacterized protein n=1 Tax=Brachionus plicatilis TaxID=10195 RepID=A0A3M7QES1_BRAPC|nr:hypothetical protein BpHYR1_019624 [Brachionus plicatilis]
MKNNYLIFFSYLKCVTCNSLFEYINNPQCPLLHLSITLKVCSVLYFLHHLVNKAIKSTQISNQIHGNCLTKFKYASKIKLLLKSKKLPWLLENKKSKQISD